MVTLKKTFHFSVVPLPPSKKMIETRFKTELNKAPVILSFSYLVSLKVKKLAPKVSLDSDAASPRSPSTPFP